VTAVSSSSRWKASVLRSFGLGLITGAADDDCSAVGTYAQAGAGFGYALLWTAPYLLPMMVAVVYLSSKLGQVTGQGLFPLFTLTIPGGSSTSYLSVSCSVTLSKRAQTSEE
jgi:Mn2+/Fe2+ NRAMP family transporter